MKKYLWIFLILIIAGGGLFLYFANNNNNQKDYVAERTTTNTTKENFINENTVINTNQEKTIAEFSTKLPNDTEARDDNIKLACKTLNETVVKRGEEFSLWEVLGCPSKETGYEKAKTFTSDGKVTKAYGGGICQLSTTIYNAVLKTEGLEVTERHEHSRDVPYIKDGKDAAVSYGSADLKFKNTLDTNVKIKAEVKNRTVKITLVSI